MDLVIFNSLLYVGTLLVYWFRRRKIDAGFILLAVYAAIAIACVFNYASDPDIWELQLWPFLYLYVVCMLFFRPYFFDSNILYERLYVRSESTLNVFTIVFITCSIISVYYSVSLAIENINSGSWSELRNKLYAGEIELYSNQLERFSNIFVQYLSPLAIILLFYYLTLKLRKPIFLIILSISSIAPTFIISINTASRGILVNLSVSIFMGYVIFRKGIPQRINKAIYIYGLSLLSIFLIYSLAVTSSRFSGSESSSSLLSYFGQSMLVFNYGLSDSIYIYADGKFFFNWFLPFLEISPFNYYTNGTHFGTSFFTFVGAWYLDFGPVGTFIIAICLPIVISHSFRNKNRVDLADLFIFFFYFNYLIQGVFVIGRGNALAWVMAFIIYGILKIIK